MVGHAKFGIQILQLGQPLGGQFLGPVIGGSQAERTRRREGGDVDVALADAQVMAVFAGAAALHGGGHHDTGKGGADARIETGNHHRLRAATAGAGAADALRIDPFQGQQEVDRTQAIPSLQAKVSLQAQVRAGAEKPRLGGTMAVFGELHGIGIPEHVIEEGRTAHARELDAARLQRRPRRALQLLGAGVDLLLRRRRADATVHEAAIRPMPVRAEHGRHFRRALLRQVQTAGDEVPRQALEKDAVHRVIVALDPAVHDRVERGLFRHRPEAGGDRHAPLDLRAPRRPGLLGGDRGHREVPVEIAHLARRRLGRGETDGEQGEEEGLHGEDQAHTAAGAPIHQCARELFWNPPFS